jgi:ribose transport system ATP-binding protein
VNETLPETQPEPPRVAPAMLEVRGLSKSFPGTRALSDVNLTARAGEVLALMGQNGAGKSTLLKILAGAIRADQGQIELEGVGAQIASPLEARAAGINLIYQEPNLVPNLTVTENIFMGCERRRGPILDRKTMVIQSEMMLERLCAQFSSTTLVAELRLADRQLVEIARALMFKGRILLMDEPTAALNAIETATLFEIITQLRSQGMTIVYTSHRINEVYSLADRVTVLRNGENAGTLEREDIHPDRIVEMMIGHKPAEFHRIPLHDHATPPVLEVQSLSDGRKLEPTTLRLRSGEILGLSGVLGAGHSELLRLIFGADRQSQGAILIDGQARTIHSPGAAIRHGIGYVPANGLEEGLFLEMNAEENVTLPVLGQHSVLGVLNVRALGQSFERAMRHIRFSLPQSHARAQHLSSGSQQKLLIARWLSQHARSLRVLLLDEPTKGVDIQAKHEIYRIIAELSETGLGVIVISSDVSELERLCDRVIVMRRGEIVGELEGIEITQGQIMALATGVRSAFDFV